MLAGAGSGKTRVLTTRIAALIDRHGVPPDRIFAVTFTNKAAGEMKHRIGRLLQRDPSGLWIGTFHSLSARLLRREAELLGFTRRFTIYDEDDRLSLIKRLMDQRGHSAKLFPPRAVQSAHLGGEEPDGAAVGARAGLRPVRPPRPRSPPTCTGAMGPALKAANAMDFDDLLLHPLTLFREHPDRLRAYQQRFSFILVDEFQDTNRAQYAADPAAGRARERLRRGRRRPVHLRLARRRRAQHAGLPARLSRAPSWSGWRRTTAPPRSCSTPRTASSPRTAAGSARR